jgi:hypothetical protein
VIHQRARLPPGNVQRGYIVIKRYQVLPSTAPVPAPDDVLEMLVREGARKMLQAMLEVEIDEFLGRQRYQRTDRDRRFNIFITKIAALISAVRRGIVDGPLDEEVAV